MDTYTFSNRFKRIKDTNNIRPDIRRPCGISLSFLNNFPTQHTNETKTFIKQDTIKDRLKEICQDKRSRHYKYCYDQVDKIKYLYDLDLFRKHKTQDLKLICKIQTIENRLKRSYENGCITLTEYEKQIELLNK